MTPADFLKSKGYTIEAIECHDQSLIDSKMDILQLMKEYRQLGLKKEKLNGKTEEGFIVKSLVFDGKTYKGVIDKKYFLQPFEWGLDLMPLNIECLQTSIDIYNHKLVIN